MTDRQYNPASVNSSTENFPAKRDRLEGKDEGKFEAVKPNPSLKSIFQVDCGDNL